jgi:hypothetical protein
MSTEGCLVAGGHATAMLAESGNAGSTRAAQSLGKPTHAISAAPREDRGHAPGRGAWPKRPGQA